MPTKMPTEELARRFGAKLRGRGPDVEQTLPVAMTQLLLAIATLEQQQSEDAEVGSSPDKAPDK